MRKHRLPQLIKYIDVRGVNKSMIEFNANLDKLNDFFSIFPKWGISVTIKLLKELKNDSEAMCDKYFSIISERILNVNSEIRNFFSVILEMKTKPSNCKTY